MNSGKITFSPKIDDPVLSRIIAFCKKLSQVCRNKDPIDRELKLRQIRREMSNDFSPTSDTQVLKLVFLKSAFMDLASVGWQVSVKGNSVSAKFPDHKGASNDKLKSVVRNGHLVERDAQLNQTSVRSFIKEMERRRLTDKGWHSIFSLMRCGKDLADNLREISSLNDEEEVRKKLETVVKPFLQFVTPNAVCDRTGLPLQDIWRYFRSTWSNSYKSLPGRSMSVLVRDAAAPNHPVIGIAALGSSVAQQKIRDVWIGWDPEEVVKTILEKPSSSDGKWLLDSLAAEIAGIYREDLIEGEVLSPVEIENPKESTIKKLKELADDEITQHRLFPGVSSHKVSTAEQVNEVDWEVRARSPLFRSKRCRTLAKLLRIRHDFQQNGLISGSTKQLRKALESSVVQKGTAQLVRMVKARHVGINMMDIIACGAIAPYNQLLGGKLVCMLMCSPEVVSEYRRRYGSQSSVIASSMKGEAVVRDPKLVLLGTTSLYGVGSSQYNRVKIPCEVVGGNQGMFVEFENLGKSVGYGSYHISDLTVRTADLILARSKSGRKVNSIFGEGVNPRMRKLREAFSLVGLPPDAFLKHGNSRIVYGIRLAKNSGNVLLGKSKRPQYLIPQSSPKVRTEQISDFWRRRWLQMRIQNSEVLASIQKNQLSYPVEHGAKVQLPLEDLNQSELDFS